MISGDHIRAESAISMLDTSALELVADSLPNGVLLAAPDGTIHHANRVLADQFGYSRDELIGQPVEMLLPEPLREVHHEHRRRFQAEPNAVPVGAGRELIGRRRDGSLFPVEIGLSPVETPQGMFALAVVFDITTRREIESTTRVALEQRLAFEQFLTETSVQFINVPADEVSDVIQVALRRTGEELDLDRCTFYRIEPDGMLVEPVSWLRAGVVTAASVASANQFPWMLERFRAGDMVSFNRVDEIPSEPDREGCRQRRALSAVLVPLSVGGDLVGAVAFSMVRAERTWTDDVLHRLRTVGSAFASVLARRQGERALQGALAEVKRLSDQFEAENVYLRREVQERLGTGLLVGQSPAVRQVLDLVHQVAATDSTVLLIGETGTGKEVFATQIHDLSGRRSRAMVRVNCSAIPSTLMESELFGREKGAYTGALARQIGRFELADRSSIFLDEIGELPPEVQVKLLRVLEERQIERLGSPTPIRVDTRIIAATHRDLEKRISEGAFREDLFYRLNVFPIHVPPLRDRVEDIPLLVWRFVEEFSKAFGKQIEAIPRENMAELQRYAWPGNIRELRNVVERAMITASGPRLTIALPQQTSSSSRRSTRLADVEREHIRSVVESAGWRIRGTGGAADRLGLKPTTLETRMAKLGITRPRAQA